MYTLSLAGYKRSAVLDAGGWIPNGTPRRPAGLPPK